MMNIKDRYDSLFQFYGEAHKVDWMLLKAQAMAESQMDPDAVSKVGAKGLTQFMDATFAQYKPTMSPDPLPEHMTSPHVPNIYNPEDAIRAQAKIMKTLIVTFGVSAKALAAYNWGYGNLRRCLDEYKSDWENHIPNETKKYIEKIMNLVYNAHAKENT